MCKLNCNFQILKSKKGPEKSVIQTLLSWAISSSQNAISSHIFLNQSINERVKAWLEKICNKIMLKWLISNPKDRLKGQSFTITCIQISRVAWLENFCYNIKAKLSQIMREICTRRWQKWLKVTIQRLLQKWPRSGSTSTRMLQMCYKKLLVHP